MKKREKRIEPIKSNEDFNSKTTSRKNIFNLLNFLGPIEDMYSKTLQYRIEAKRLDSEVKRVQAQAKVEEQVIDKMFQLKMEDLRQRREHLLAFYKTIDSQSKDLHIEKMTVLKSLEMLVKRFVEPDIDFEERKLYKEGIELIRSDIVNLGKKSSDTLDVIAKTIPPVQIPKDI